MTTTSFTPSVSLFSTAIKQSLHANSVRSTKSSPGLAISSNYGSRSGLSLLARLSTSPPTHGVVSDTTSHLDLSLASGSSLLARLSPHPTHQRGTADAGRSLLERMALDGDEDGAVVDTALPPVGIKAEAVVKCETYQDSAVKRDLDGGSVGEIDVDEDSVVKVKEECTYIKPDASQDVVIKHEDDGEEAFKTLLDEDEVFKTLLHEDEDVKTQLHEDEDFKTSLDDDVKLGVNQGNTELQRRPIKAELDEKVHAKPEPSADIDMDLKVALDQHPQNMKAEPGADATLDGDTSAKPEPKDGSVKPDDVPLKRKRRRGGKRIPYAERRRRARVKEETAVMALLELL